MMAADTRTLIKTSLVNLLFVISLGCLASVHGALDQFMGNVLPTLAIAQIILYGSMVLRADALLSLAGVFLFEIGTTLQILIGWKQHLILFSVAALVMAVGCVFGYMLLERFPFGNNGAVARMLAIIFGATMAAVLILRLGGSINGTYAWLTIGSLSLQITEFFKPMFVIYHALLFRSDLSRKWLWSLGYAGALILSLLLLNELGTMLVIFLLWIALSFLFFDRKRISGFFAAGTVCAGGLGWIICRSAADKVLANAQLGQETSGFLRTLASIHAKLDDRIQIWCNLDGIDPYGTAMQALKAREAMIKGGFLGTTSPVQIPVEASDYAFIALILRCGIITAVAALILFVLIFARGTVLFSTQKDRFHATMLAGCTYCLTFPTLINILGTTNFIPMTGVAIPFLSAGGTSMCLSFACLIILIYRSGTPITLAPRKKKPADKPVQPLTR